MNLQLGLDVIRSYKRLAYTPWHALAEFVDNSTQSYKNNQSALDAEFERTGDRLEVSIIYERDGEGLVQIVDNAMGMTWDELEYALHVGAPPADTSGRSQFGMGMKTASCWLGNEWTVRTKKLHETTEYEVTINVEAVAAGENGLDVVENKGRDPEDHYTIVSVTQLNHRFQGRTLGKIKQFLASMYRQDLRSNTLRLLWQGQELQWADSDEQFVLAKDGKRYRKRFEFKVNGKRVHGWVGVLEKGSRAKAGFSILRRDRVIRGWPDSWRPESLYGQLLGSNDLVNQRLIGEIHLDEFEVSHTKDDILWMGDELEKVENALKRHCADYREFAKARRKGDEDEAGPTDLEIKTAVDEFTRELESPELSDIVLVDAVPPPAAVADMIRGLLASVDPTEPTFRCNIGGVGIVGYLESVLSPNDPYVAVDATRDDLVAVVINQQHPHFSELKGANGVLNYLRHCTYDAVAEWQARQKAGNLDPETIKILKDRLLRVPLEMQMHEAFANAEEDVEIPA
jgi:hypothetical protein